MGHSAFFTFGILGINQKRPCSATQRGSFVINEKYCFAEDQEVRVGTPAICADNNGDALTPNVSLNESGWAPSQNVPTEANGKKCVWGI